MTRKRITWAIVIGLLVVGGYVAYHAQNPPSTATQSTDDEEDAAAETIVWASGELLPAQWAELSFSITGLVDAVLVSEGEGVLPGASLIRLASRDLEADLQAAQSAQQTASGELALLEAPPRPEEVSRLTGAVQEAEANVAKARATLRQARSNHEKLLAGTRDEQVKIALATLKKAENSLQVAQAEYDKVRWSDSIGSSPEAAALQQATLDYEAADAQYQEALNGATSQEIAASQAQVDAAAADVDQMEALVAQAQAGLALLQAGARSEEIEIAEARLAEADAGVDKAISALAKTVLHAPFAGTIGAVYVRQGELVTPDNPVLVLGNLEHLRVETTDLRETDVTRIDIGQPVEVTFDALPDVILQGHVSHIDPKSNEEKGSVNYRAVIELDDWEPRLRWGMTAYVNSSVEP